MAERKKQFGPIDRAALGTQALRGMKRTLLRFRTLMDERLRPQGVTMAQVQILFAIRQSPDSSGAQLARNCYVRPQSIQAVLKQLEDAGLISRNKDSVNDRIITASLTPSGEKMVKAVEKISAEIQEQLWEGIATPELQQLNTALDKCIANLGGDD